MYNLCAEWKEATDSSERTEFCILPTMAHITTNLRIRINIFKLHMHMSQEKKTIQDRIQLFLKP
jgi:hypothetical protein